jgi:hypothetical protein
MHSLRPNALVAGGLVLVLLALVVLLVVALT